MPTHSARYIGPVGQLRGKTCVVESRYQFAGFAFCKFDDRKLMVAGKAMAGGWFPIKLAHLRKMEATENDR
jgi:hypothetical protein